MKGWLELLPSFLSAYPVWARVVAVSLPPLYVLAIALLYALAPTPVVAIETFRAFATKPTSLAFDVNVRNPTNSVVSITGADLELYAGTRPEGGLLSATTTSVRYTITKQQDETLVQSDHEDLPFAVSVVRPYAGNPYERMKVPLSQEIDPGRIDRFTIVLDKADLVRPEHDTCALKLTYDGNKSTEVVTLKLR